MGRIAYLPISNEFEMTRTKKEYGFRPGDIVANWVDRFGRKGGRIVKLIYLDYLKQFQILISNGDVLTGEFILQDEFYARGLCELRWKKQK